MAHTDKRNGHAKCMQYGDFNGIGERMNTDAVTEHPLPLNPFVHDPGFSTLNKIQLIFMSVTIFPIRATFVFIWLVLAWFFAFIALFGRRKEDLNEPLTGWRDRMRHVVAFCCRCMFFSGGFHRLVTIGERASSKDAPILAIAPHSSFYDSIVVCVLKMTSIVIKSAAADIPFYGTLTRFTQPVLVSREDPASRQNTVSEIRRRAATGGKWPQIIVFAEGTCTNRSCLISFKPGAFIPGVAVQPVCIRYKNIPDVITWTWNGPSALMIIWYSLCQFNNKIEIEFLPVYRPNEEEKMDAKLFGQNVRKLMAKALNLEETEHSFEDGLAMTQATELRIPIAESLVHISLMARLSGLTKSRLEEILPRLSDDVQSDKFSHFKHFDEYANFFGISTASKAFEKIFAIHKQTGSDAVDVRPCLLEFKLLTCPTSLIDVLEFAFKVYDQNKKGFLEKAELSAMLSSLGFKWSHFFSTDINKITYDKLVEAFESNPKFAKLFTQNNNRLTQSQQVSGGVCKISKTKAKVKPE